MNHPFEKSGCGVAPFAFVGSFRKVGPLDMGNGMFVGSPGQPMGICAHCGTAIAECCVIRDAHGKEFVVGNVCVSKTEDMELIVPAKEAKREADAARRAAGREAKDLLRIAEYITKLESPSVIDILSSYQHPNEYFAAQGKTWYEYARFMLLRGGINTAIATCKAIDRVITRGRRSEGQMSG
jgi:hypothetical protein